jgi:hypothetical protein
MLFDEENASPMAQRIRQFNLANGSDGIQLRGWFVYSNGARRDTDPMGILSPPPADPRERVEIQTMYHEELLRRAVQAFDEFKQQMVANAKLNLNQTSQVPPPPCDQEAAVQKLLELQDVVRARQKTVETFKRRLEALRPAWQIAQQRQDQRNLESNANFVAALSEIEI